MFSKKIYVLTHSKTNPNSKTDGFVSAMSCEGYDVEILDTDSNTDGDFQIDERSIVLDIRYDKALEVSAETALSRPQKSYVYVVLDDSYASPRILSNDNNHYIGHPKAFRLDSIMKKLDEMLPQWVEGFKKVEAQVELKEISVV